MLLRQRIKNEVIASIKQDPNFKEVYNIARRNAYGPVYLVGGRVYRTLIEKIHKYPVEASRSDWDFLVLGQVRRAFIPNGWVEPNAEWAMQQASSSGISVRNNAVKANSLTLVNETIGLLDKVKLDLIAIKDIVIGTKEGYNPNRYQFALNEQFGLKEYFDAVPLDIQCIALDIENDQIHANRALGAIESKTLKINNPKGALPDLNIGPYIDRKAASLGFKYDDTLETRIPCTCFNNQGVFAAQMLWNMGCQMPNSHR